MIREPSATPQMLRGVSINSRSAMNGDLHGISCPEEECESSNAAEKGSGLGIFGLDSISAIDEELIDNDKIGSATECVPSPAGGSFSCGSSK